MLTMSNRKMEIRGITIKEIEQETSRIFMQSLFESIDEKYKEVELSEISKRALVLETIRNGLQLAFKEILAISLFGKEEDRWHWEKLFDSFRYLAQNINDSFLMNSVLPSLKLENSSEKALSFIGEVSTSLIKIDLFFKEISRYIENYDYAVEIAQSYDQRNKHLEAKYVLCKTWRNNTEWNDFMNLLDEIINQKIEIFIEGPLQLFLMISKEEVFMLLKIFTTDTVFGLSDKSKENKIELKTAYDFFDYFRNKIEASETIRLFQDILIKTIQKSVMVWKEEASLYRNEFVNQELRQSFIDKFESGKLFRDNR